MPRSEVSQDANTVVVLKVFIMKDNPGIHLFGWLCHALVTALFLPMVLSTCVFPDYMQSDANNRDWRGQVKSQYTEFTLTITVNNNMMNVISTDTSATTYTRSCMQALSDDKFITSHEQNRQRSQGYVCIQFIHRADNVIQLRESQIVSSMYGACDLDMHLDPWIWIDKNNILTASQPCPLTGGYSIKLYDKEYQMSMCDAYKDHVWMESECVVGKGLYFNFRYGRCIPNVLMSNQQRTFCLANWTDGAYSFILLRHDTQSYMWLMRYPADEHHLSSFVAQLMKDLFASSGSHITEINTYVQMDMVRDVAHPVSSLCIDEFEGCNYYADPCAEGGETALTCARTCGVCNETRPVMCSFNDAWHGDWIDATHGDRVATTFQSNILTVYYSRLQQKFHCIHWDNPYSGPAVKNTRYIMLITEFDNGCRPQYSCAKIVHRDSSAVMFLQLSSERHWPFTNTISDPINCDNFEFKGDTNSLMPNRYRSKHYRLLYSKSLDTGTTCNMPLSGVTNYTVTLSDMTICTGRIRTSTSGSSVTVRLTQCNNRDSSVLRDIPREHTCVESSRLFNSDLLVISRTDVEPYQLYCWLFPKRTPDIFYMVQSAHCNDNTKRQISRGNLQPLAAFSNAPVTQAPVSVPSPPRTIEIGDSVENTEPGDNSVTSTDNATRDYSTVPPSHINPASYGTPIVVVAAIILFIVFQFPCMCKDS